MPDLVGFQLTGAKVSERTNASTTGLVGVESGEWDDELIERLGLAASVFAPLVDPGESIGGLRPRVAADLGAPAGIEVVAVGSHDTASAVVAVPMRAESAAYISCGTWGLVGVELEHPVTTDAARLANFTNEGGVDGRVRFLHNVMGLWLLSESVRWWERDGERIDLPELLAAAASVTAPVPVFDANDPGSSLRATCPAASPSGAWIAASPRRRAAPSSRARSSRASPRRSPGPFATRRSCRASTSRRSTSWAAAPSTACSASAPPTVSGLPVLAGPVEATAIGNVLVQARAQGFAGGDLESLRALVASAFAPTRYEPAVG